MAQSLGANAAIALAIVASLAEASFAQEPQPEPATSRVIDINLTLNLPVGPCHVPNLVLALAKHLGVPAGAEMLPGPCVSKAPPAITERIPLIALRFEEALDLMVKADPRYYWVDADGVIVVRPLNAWTNEKHFLNVTLERFDLEKAHIGAALHAALAPLRMDGRSGTDVGDPAQLTLSLGPISVGQALDAIARAHGKLWWSIEYCVPELAADVARVSLRTYEDRGIGTYAAGPRLGPDGKPTNLCYPKK
jgi:hypothetical protein